MTHATSIDLRDLIDALIDIREGDEHLSPASIAAQAVARLTENELRHLASLYLRQLARAACRKKFGRDGEEDEGADRDQSEMFPEERFPGLQRRYPAAARSDRKERVYVLRNVMAAHDVAYNCRRLRGEAKSKADHAAALEQWWLTRQASGAMSPAA